MTVTNEQKRQWKEEAEAHLAAKNKRQAEEVKRAQLQQHLRVEAQSAAKEEKARAEALHLWIQQGGSPGAFEKQWEGDEGIYAQIIRQRVVTAMAGSDRARALAKGHTPLSI